MKTKILFAVNSYYPAIGGAEKVCMNMVHILKNAGHDVTVLTQPHSDRAENYDMTKFVELQGKTVYSYMPGLADYLNTHDFDLYISFGYGKYFTDYIGYWCKKHNKKSIVMPCGSFHTSSNLLLKKIYARIATKWSLNNFSCRVVATQWEKDFWHDEFGVTNDNTFVIQYNLEKDFTKYKKTNILKRYGLKKKKYLLYIGRTGPNKLIQLLKDAYNITSKKMRLVIAGKGNEEFNYLDFNHIMCENVTEVQSKDIMVNRNILSMGTVSEDDKKTLIAGAKLCIFPSAYESFGMVLLESLALGTPVIGSNIGPFKEILGRDELIFENDVNSLARKIERSFEDDYPVIRPNLPDYKWNLLGLVKGMQLKMLPSIPGNTLGIDFSEYYRKICVELVQRESTRK